MLDLLMFWKVWLLHISIPGETTDSAYNEYITRHTPTLTPSNVRLGAFFKVSLFGSTF